MPELPGLWSLSPIAALVGIIVLLFFMLATGKLLTKTQHLQIVAAHEKLAEVQQEAISEWRRSTHNLEARAIVLPNPAAADQAIRASGGD